MGVSLVFYEVEVFSFLGKGMRDAPLFCYSQKNEVKKENNCTQICVQ